MSIAEVDARSIARSREELEQGGYHPLSGDDTSGFLRRFVQQLSPRGEFSDEGAPISESDDPVLGRDPVVFLRERTLGFATAIEAVLQDLQNQVDLPRPLVNVVGVEHPTEEAGENSPPTEPQSDADDILLSKPANLEQIQIAERLQRHGSVLVQGPPGTGKTHTIANLIGHLLAQGNSVLVTTHTTKALRVLRHHVVEQLRPLCVSVLENDLESRKQLEDSVDTIVERLSKSDARQLESEATTLTAQRKELLARLRKLHQDLLNELANEYRDLIIAGKGYSPSDAARKVALEKEENGWIPAPVALGAPLPLSEGEIIDLYRTSVTVTPEDELELSSALPKPDEIQTPEEFHSLVIDHANLVISDLTYRSDLWNHEPGTVGAEDLESLAERLRRAIDPIVANQAWKLAAISAGQKGKPYREPWDLLLTMINVVIDQAARTQESQIRYGPRLSGEMPLDAQNKIIDEILRHLVGGRKLGGLTLLIHPAWKRFIREANVATGPAHLPEHFYALKDRVNLEISRRALAGRWERQLSPLGAPARTELGPEPERVCAQFASAISESLEWHAKVWEPLASEFKNLGFRWESFLAEQPPDLSPYGELMRLRAAVSNAFQLLAGRVKAIRLQHLEAKVKTLTRTLALSAGGERSAQAVDRLLEAVNRMDPDAYGEAYRRLVELQSRRGNLERRRELLARLEPVAPAWASAIRERRGLHGGPENPKDPQAAWLWRQLNDELERRCKTSLQDLEKAIMGLTADLQRVTAELVDRRAWTAQVRRTTLSQRQALVGWLDTIRKIGKGFGKRVPLLRAEAARLMSKCRTAVPVWIMPLSRVVENFDPRTTRVDVVIIDEASQSDVMALLAFYLAKKIVVVGDQEQVSPSAVGQKLEVVQHLIDEHLEGIPNAHLYDGQTSVYDLGRQSFGGNIVLLEHFRCVPEIIQFSNWLSYNGRIKPLRDPTLVQLKPHVIPYRVRGTRSDSKLNWEEALTVASLVVASIEQPEYVHETIGIISLVGEEQALEIQRLLLRHLKPEEFDRRKILCGTAAQFQGDERDVTFLSLVDVSDDGPLPFRDLPMFKQRFNVAASRARDQMWIVHSLDPRSDLKPGDLRRRLIEHAEDPLAVIRALEKEEKRAESELERAVMRNLVHAGYRVHSQWSVGYYRIDLVVEGGGRRLAIECDGDRFHPIEKLSEDMARQAVLERLGWKFSRVRGSQFFRDPDAAMKPVIERLKSMDIPPEGVEHDASPREEVRGAELRERVIRRAAELSREWLNDKLNDNIRNNTSAQFGPKRTEGPKESRGEHRQARSEQQPGLNSPEPPRGQQISNSAPDETKLQRSIGQNPQDVAAWEGNSMKQELTFVIERETKNTVRYKEEGNGPLVVGTLYVAKHALPSPRPKQLKVTIEMT